MINTQINSLLKSSSRHLLIKSFLNNTNSNNNVIKHITKPFFKINQNKTLLNTKSFCEKNQTNNKNINENFEQNTTSNQNNEEFISFGYKTVKKDERQEMVNSVFANVAKRYF